MKKISKNVMIILILFFTVFNLNSYSWSQALPENKIVERITIEKNDFFYGIRTYQISEASLTTNNCNSYTWAYSILIPGLGQILDGDTYRGLKFIFIEFGLLALSMLSFFIYNQTGISQYNVSTPRTPSNLITGITFSVLGAILLLFLPFIHIWNIIDAYALSKDLNCGIQDKKTSYENLEFANSGKNDTLLSLNVIRF